MSFLCMDYVCLCVSTVRRFYVFLSTYVRADSLTARQSYVSRVMSGLSARANEGKAEGRLGWG